MDIDAYLKRIGYDGPRMANLDTLRGMHRAHFQSVPFENYDIHIGRRIEVDEAMNFEKIVTNGRGGFCLELSGTFARALRQLGFTVDVLSGRVMSEGKLSEPLSHMTLLVHLEEPWLADVGFGARVAEPLRLAERGVQQFGDRDYTIANDGDHWFLTCNEPGSPQGFYVFTLQPRAFEEFDAVCHWLQTSPDSRFTQGPFATIPTDRGRATLAGPRLIVTEDGARQEHELGSEEERDAVLRERFGIVLVT